MTEEPFYYRHIRSTELGRFPNYRGESDQQRGPNYYGELDIVYTHLQVPSSVTRVLT